MLSSFQNGHRRLNFHNFTKSITLVLLTLLNKVVSTFCTVIVSSRFLRPLTTAPPWTTSIYNKLLYLPTQICFPVGGERVTCRGLKLTNSLGKQQLLTRREVGGGVGVTAMDK